MAKQTWVNIDGTWRKVKSVWLNIGGTWKKDVMPKGVVNGEYKEFMKYKLDYPFVVEDFEDKDLTPYTINGLGAEVQSDIVYEGNYALKLKGTDEEINGESTSEVFSIQGLEAYPKAGEKFSFFYRIGYGRVAINFFFGVQDKDNYYKIRISDYVGYNVSLYRVEDGIQTQLGSNTEGEGYIHDTWVRVEVSWGLNGDISIIANGDNMLSVTDITYTDGGIGFGNAHIDDKPQEDNTCYFDYLVIEGEV